ncbi:mannose-P-dolichol utilization defect 1 protein-like [Physella acuta]|uniref:mannose-P-dolichol utilization defect 1 protein-like n=1 Tax=Physella acuta TaxID=109671 RepID=UPI0027DE3115|nr:mannose-P-dolichol utilization defect 1 protein-like [Physella acuta]
MTDSVTADDLLLLLCTALSYSVMVIACVYKAPQVYAVVKSGSSLGISLQSLIMEFTSYTIEMTYQYAMDYTFITYFEITVMWAQDVVLFYVVLKNRHLLGPGLIPYIVLYPLNQRFPNWEMFPIFAFWRTSNYLHDLAHSSLTVVRYCVAMAVMAKRWLPDWIMYGLILSTVPVITGSKGVQLWKVLKTKNPGSLSALTWGLLAYMAGARVLTNLLLIKDVPLLLNAAITTVLNVAISSSILFYNYKKKARSRTRAQSSRVWDLCTDFLQYLHPFYQRPFAPCH